MDFVIARVSDLGLPPLTLPVITAVLFLALMVLSGVAARALMRIEDSRVKPRRVIDER
jgi:hypothetical protein